MADKVNRKELIGVLSRVKPALSNQDFLPILQCFCFTDDTIYAYDDVMAVSFPNEGFPFEGAIPGDRLLKVLNSFKTEEIICKVKGSDIKITSGKSNIKLPFLDEDDFVWEGIPKKGTIVKMDLTSDFIRGLKSCLISIGQDQIHPEHMGVQLSCSEEEASLHSTDNSTLSKYYLDCDDIGLYEDFDPVVLPEIFCRQLISLFTAMEEPELHISTSGMWVEDDASEITIFSKFLHQGEGTDFSQIINKYTKATKGPFYTIEGTGLIESLERALIVNGDDFNKITDIDLEKGILKLKTITERGQVLDEIRMGKPKNDKDSVSVGFSTDLVLRACKSLAKISFNEKIILFKSGDNFTHMVAPRSGE